MYLAVWVQMTGPVDRTSPPGAMHQPRPVRIEARLINEAGDLEADFSAWIRHETGWTYPEESVEIARRSGIRTVSFLPILADMNANARCIIAHDAAETDLAIRVCRALYKPDQTEWIRPTQGRIDTATAAAKKMPPKFRGTIPTIAAATKAVLGEELGGLAGVLAIYTDLELYDVDQTPIEGGA